MAGLREDVNLTELVNSHLGSDSTQKHLERTLRLWLGLRRDKEVGLPEMPDHLKRLFLRCEEHTYRHRDQWGAWEHAFSLNYRQGKLWTPEVDIWVSELRNTLVREGVELEPPWPEKRVFALCLTHDVDAISDQITLTQKIREVRKHLVDESSVSPIGLATRVVNSIRPAIRGVLTKSYTHPNAERVIEVVLRIEKEFDVRSSFFFTAYPLTRYSQYDCQYSLRDPCRFRGERMRISDMMRIIADEGYDVGLHGSYHSASDGAMLKEQKEMIEDALGSTVVTTRQHWLNWNVQSTPKLQSEAGLMADSTLGFNRNVGFRSGTTFPYYLFDLLDEKRSPLIEVPLVIHDGPLLSSDGLEYDLHMAQEVMKLLIDRVIEVGGCMTLSFHPHSFLDDVYERLYRWSIGYCLDRNGWVTSLKGILDWWKQRERIIEEETEP